MRENELLVYKNFENEELFGLMSFVMNNYELLSEEERTPKLMELSEKLRSVFYDCIHRLIELSGNYGFYGNLWHDYLTDLLVNDENAYSRACEVRGETRGTINQAVLHDIGIIKEFFDFDFKPVMDCLSVPEFSMILDYERGDNAGKVYNERICRRICELAESFREDDSPEEMKDTLTKFYKEIGAGKFGLHKSFRVEESAEGVRIVPILNIAHVRFDDLVGYEWQKDRLKENTDAFVAHKKANNCLLFGDAGTGKSSCIKAVANEYFDKGIRIIEVYKHQFKSLNAVISQIKSRNYRFIIYMDDLSFEDNETDYKYLKALIEGGLEKKPENILIYATSNRRHLIRENYEDKGEVRQDMHTSDTVQEKLSLAYRFGITIYFGAPAPEEFRNIVTELAKRSGIDMPREELLLEANKWELNHGGLSGRTARQFIDYMSSRI